MALASTVRNSAQQSSNFSANSLSISNKTTNSLKTNSKDNIDSIANTVKIPSDLYYTNKNDNQTKTKDKHIQFINDNKNKNTNNTKNYSKITDTSSTSKNLSNTNHSDFLLNDLTIDTDSSALFASEVINDLNSYLEGCDKKSEDELYSASSSFISKASVAPSYADFPTRRDSLQYNHKKSFSYDSAVDFEKDLDLKGPLSKPGNQFDTRNKFILGFSISHLYDTHKSILHSYYSRNQNPGKVLEDFITQLHLLLSEFEKFLLSASKSNYLKEHKSNNFINSNSHTENKSSTSVSNTSDIQSSLKKKESYKSFHNSKEYIKAVSSKKSMLDSKLLRSKTFKSHATIPNWVWTIGTGSSLSWDVERLNNDNYNAANQNDASNKAWSYTYLLPAISPFYEFCEETVNHSLSLQLSDIYYDINIGMNIMRSEFNKGKDDYLYNHDSSGLSDDIFSNFNSTGDVEFEIVNDHSGDLNDSSFTSQKPRSSDVPSRSSKYRSFYNKLKNSDIWDKVDLKDSLMHIPSFSSRTNSRSFYRVMNSSSTTMQDSNSENTSYINVEQQFKRLDKKIKNILSKDADYRSKSDISKSDSTKETSLLTNFTNLRKYNKT